MITDNTPRVLVVGTGNIGKLREIRTILGNLPWTIKSLNDYGTISSPDEEGDTYAQNAIAKAQYYASATSEWSLADDSGLEVRVLGGAPGLFSARYAGESASDEDRRRLLLSQLQQHTASDRSARFVCAVAIARPEGDLAAIVEGTCEGVIVNEPRGFSGFGYDPLFQPDGYDRTFAELADSVKNSISHRANALARARAFLLTV